MSDCNCKSKSVESVDSNPENNPKLPNQIINYFVRSIGFILSIILLPFINFMIIKMLFQTIILNQKVDLKGLLEYYFKKKEIEEDDDDEDYLDLNEDEVKMLNVEEIK